MDISRIMIPYTTKKRSIAIATLLVATIALSPLQANALPPLTIDDAESIFISEHYRDGGPLVVCNEVGEFSDPEQVGQAISEDFSARVAPDGRTLQPHHIAGILGNVSNESSLNPAAVNPTSGAYGLFQFLPPEKYFTYADRIGADRADIGTQIDYVWGQLIGDAEVAGVGWYEAEAEVLENLLNTTNAADAARVWALEYERFGGEEAEVQERIDDANAALLRLTGGGDGETEGGEISAGEEAAAAAGDNCTIGQPSVVEAAGINFDEVRQSGAEFNEAFPDGNTADFVSYTLQQAGTPLTGGDEGYRYSSVTALQEFYQNTPGYAYQDAATGSPRAGDVIFFVDQERGIESTGIVSSVNGSTITYITINAEGEVVELTQQAAAGQNGLAGYGRRVPTQGSGGTSSPPVDIPGGCITADGYVNPKPGECVGVPAGTTLRNLRGNTDTSKIVEIRGGEVVDGEIIYGCVDITGPGAVIRNSRIICYKSRDQAGHANKCAPYSGCHSHMGSAIRMTAGARSGTRALIERNDILCGDGPGATLRSGIVACDMLINGGNVTARLNNLSQGTDGFAAYKNGSNATYEYNYVHNLQETLDETIERRFTKNNTNRHSHVDAVQVHTASNVKVHGNFFQGRSDNGGPAGHQGMLMRAVSNLNVTNNRFHGYFKSLRIKIYGGGGSVKNNIIDSVYKSSWVIDYEGGSYSTSGNKFDDGTAVGSSHIR